MVFQQCLDLQDSNERPMFRYDSLVGKFFAVSDGEKMSASYDDIVDLMILFSL